MSDLKKKIFDTSRELQLINFATITKDGKPWVRYVMGKADDELVFRFCSHLETRKIEHIQNNPNVHISLGASDLATAEHWIQVEGIAEVSIEKAERDSFWFDDLKNYFSGPDDPGYCVVLIRPSRIEYGTMGSTTPEVWEPNR